MRRFYYFIIAASLFLNSCNTKPDAKTIEKWKHEIKEAEQNFAKMAGEEGIEKAFTTYAAEDAVIMRNNELVKGLKNIEMFYKGKTSKGLDWAPDFVEVSSSGDLGYTYGHYTYSYIDSTGNAAVDTGIFHTVWKRQPDGNWRFVWD
jgi:ketosteroid isomerase-like protein